MKKAPILPVLLGVLGSNSKSPAQRFAEPIGGYKKPKLSGLAAKAFKKNKHKRKLAKQSRRKNRH